MIKRFSVFEYQDNPQQLPADLHIASKSGEQIYFENEDLILGDGGTMDCVKTASVMAYLTMNKLYFDAYLKYLDTCCEGQHEAILTN